jgi:DNA invertase Pin-like site-specific DNA recombinase
MQDAKPFHSYATGSTTYGYARVSTTGQTLETQLQSLAATGITKIYSEKVSGVKQRRELEKLLAKLQPGDLVVITKLDRLARSTLDLLRIIEQIGKAGANFKSLGDSWADTTTPHGRLMLTVLAGLAEFERELIISRCSEGRERARAEGKSLGGQAPKLTPHQAREVMTRLAAGDSQRQIAKSFNVNVSTISRMYSKANAAAVMS